MKKGTLIAIGVFVVLLLVVLATRERQVSVGVKKIDFSTIDKNKVTGLEFSGAKSAALLKESDGWVVIDPTRGNAKHPADEQQVTSALDALTTMQISDLVSEKSEKHAEYELDDAKGLKVTIREEGKPPLNLVIGKSAKGGGVYVREAGSSTVFAAQGRFAWMARKDAKGWRKHAIVSIKPDELESVTARHKDGESFTLKKGAAAGGWDLEEGTPTPAGFRFDPQSAQRVTQTLSSVSAQDYLDPGAATDEQLGLAGSHDTLEAKLKDGKTLALHIGKEVDPQSFAPKEAADAGTAAPRSAKLVPVRVEGDPQVYLIPTYSANNLTKRLDDLRDLSLMSFDPQKAKQLVVQAGKKVVVKKEGDTWKVAEPKKLPSGFEFDPQQVVYQLERLKSFKATRLVGNSLNDAAAGVNKPSGTVDIILDDGKKQTLRFGKETTGSNGLKEVYVKGSVDAQLYAMGKDALSRLETGVELFKKPPPPPDFHGGGGMRGLESLPPDVRQKIEAQLRQQQGRP